MSTTEWLRSQVSQLEEQIRASSVFDSDNPASPADLEALRSTVVIHRYLQQQLIRRTAIVPVLEEHDTQEFVLVKR